MGFPVFGQPFGRGGFGQPIGSGGKSIVIYAIDDEYTTNLAAGSVNGATNPVVGGNDVGFELVTLAPPYLFVGYPGMKLIFLQVAATAVL